MAEVDPQTLVFLDETSTQTVMARPWARAPRGQRAVARIPRTHGHHVTCRAAITPDGITEPLVFEEALDGPLFARWLTERVLPALGPGRVLVLDTLSVHKNAAARAAVEAAGCPFCFLPPYSPDCNPIELIFSQLKAHLRGAAARTVDRLVEAIGAAFDQIAPADIQARYRHCGYALASLHRNPL
jgi:transposase